MNDDDDDDLRIYARRGPRPGAAARLARAAILAQEPARAAEAAETAETAEAAQPARATRELPAVALPSVEEQVLQILGAPPVWGETVEAAFRRKERELVEVLAAVEPAAAAELSRRLAEPRPEDPVAAAFARLVPERRARLLAFLAAAPRRAAVERARRFPFPHHPRTNE